MTALELTICERTGRWAAALRTAIARQVATSPATTCLHEVRSLSELGARLDERPNTLVMVEVATVNLDEVLAWLAEARVSRPDARSIALLDNDSRQDVSDALFEAGAIEVVRSPRLLRNIFFLCGRFILKSRVGISHQRLDRARAAGDAQSPLGQSFADWAWARLPWQNV